MPVAVQAGRKFQPGASAAGAHINDAGVARCIERSLQERGDGGVGAEEIHGVLQRVGDLVAEKSGEPRLFVEFD